MIHHCYFSNNFKKISRRITSLRAENVNPYFSCLFDVFICSTLIFRLCSFLLSLFSSIHLLYTPKHPISFIIDMEVDQTNLSLNRDAETELIIPNSSVFISNRYRHLLGLPKRIDGEYVDSEQYSWCRSIISWKSLFRFSMYVCVSF